MNPDLTPPLPPVLPEPIGWKSIAWWPYPAVMLYDKENMSDDKHHDEESARAVCRRLEREGFGGEKKIFPLKTAVEPIYPEPPIALANGIGVPFEWNQRTPDGMCWKCPNCDHWASLAENAGFHSSKFRHGIPVLEPLPSDLVGEQSPTKISAEGFRQHLNSMLEKAKPEAASLTPRTDLFEQGFREGGWALETGFEMSLVHSRQLESDLLKSKEDVDRLRAYIKKLDGIIEEVGGVTASCINPYEDLKRALTGQKEKVERFERELSQANAAVGTMRESTLQRSAQICRYYLKHQNYPSRWEDKSEYEKGVQIACENIAKSILDEIDTPPAPDGWISVKDRKPRHRQRVIAWENRFNVFTYEGEPGDDGEGRIRMGDCTYLSGEAEWAAMSDRDRAQWKNDPEEYRRCNNSWDRWKGQGPCGFADKDVTHWMPLPKPPSGNGGGE